MLNKHSEQKDNKNNKKKEAISKEKVLRWVS